MNAPPNLSPAPIAPRPPSAIRIESNWGELVRLGADDDPFWQRVRHAQLSFLERYLPMNVPIALVNSAIVLGSVADDVDRWVLGWWAFSQSLVILLALHRAWRKHQNPPAAASASRAEMIDTLWQMALVGSGWGLLFFQALGRADPTDAMLVVAMTMAGIGCLAFSTATWPLGSICMSGIVASVTIAGLFANDWGEAWMVTLVMLSFVLFIARGNVLTTFAFYNRVRLQDALIEQEEVVRLLLHEFETNGSEWLFEFDGEGRLLFASTRFADALRRPVDQVIGQRWIDFVSDRESARQLREVAGSGQPFRDIAIRTTIEGEERWWSLSGTPKLAADGRLLGYRGVGTDITDKQRTAQRVADLATFDSLTGLVNRRIIHATIEDGLRSGRVALMFVDLDRFKSVNDSMGHGAGDKLLAQVAERLRSVVGTAGIAGRLGGDEFAVVLRTGDAEEARAAGKAIIASLSEPYRIGDKTALIGASVGLAVGPADGASVEALMRAADLALYDVKGKGRGSVRAYDRALHRQAEERRSLELDLRNALSAGQLRLAFQPIVDVLDERIVGFEALMRWRHPVHGEVEPAVFIPLAEEAGLIVKMGAWALNEACRVAAGWPRGIKLSVNLSPVQFDDPALVDHVRQALARHHVPAERLELEVTESLFLDERRQTTETLATLKNLGVRFALDDFGTGYSSLGYLQKIAFSRIKIDRSFVRASVSDGGESTAIIQAIVALAERLGMETTAEGTETREEFESMRRLGCAQVQGYLFGRPMSADDAARLIDRARPQLVLEPMDASDVIRPAPIRREGNARSRAAEAHASPPRRRVRPALPTG